jgi:hypothetical protein
MDSFNNLIGKTLSRHNISRSVTAAMIVKKAEMILNKMLPPHAKKDIEIRSLLHDQLRVACLNAPAKALMTRMKTPLLDELKREFPSATIVEIFCFIDPNSQQDIRA